MLVKLIRLFQITSLSGCIRHLRACLKIQIISTIGSHFRQVDVTIHLIYRLISIFLKLSEINFNQKLLKADHKNINIHFMKNRGNGTFDKIHNPNDTDFQ